MKRLILFVLMMSAWIALQAQPTPIPHRELAPDDTVRIVSPVFDGMEFPLAEFEARGYEIETYLASKGLFYTVEVDPYFTDISSYGDSIAGVRYIFQQYAPGRTLYDSLQTWRAMYNSDLIVFIVEGGTKPGSSLYDFCLAGVRKDAFLEDSLAFVYGHETGHLFGAHHYDTVWDSVSQRWSIIHAIGPRGLFVSDTSAWRFIRTWSVGMSGPYAFSISDSTIVHPDSVTLKWRPALTDTIGGQYSYRYQLRKDGSVVQDEVLADTVLTLASLENNTEYQWRLRAEHESEMSSWSPWFTFTTDNMVDIDDEPAVPQLFALSQNYPNPFNPSTTIEFSLPQSGNIKLVVYDILGREVAILIDEWQHSGQHSVHFDASHLSAGMYVYRLTASSSTTTKKMILLK
ncbi:T9SS type A sorting domain-containing protein [Candidatus Gracilibacteria bacterium]|nr:T9SS type A sorting domain-containing protein [Candidatus Gracilibacteria bacterium]MCF7819008.1 T9SS type A sorting domain-containing protein [Candidatus Gracilibacteria bacterium]